MRRSAVGIGGDNLNCACSRAARPLPVEDELDLPPQAVMLIAMPNRTATIVITHILPYRASRLRCHARITPKRSDVQPAIAAP